MKILICGSRNWRDPRPIWEYLEAIAARHPDAKVIHGAAPGADTIAAKAADALGLTVIAVPAEWELYGRAAGPMRNKEMLGMSPDLVVGFRSAGTSRGTDHMIGLARRSRIPVRVLDAEGTWWG